MPAPDRAAGPPARLTRRRVLALTAATAAVAGLGGIAALQGSAQAAPQVWRGRALGAQASLTIHHPDRETGHRLLRQCVTELRRLEAIFSLYRADSALSRLNAAGALDDPPPELLRLLSEARRYSELTDGAFDVTVQPLWSLYADHFADARGRPSEGPPKEALERWRRLVDYRGVRVDTARVAFERPGMAITLNGIAQGYITDRAAEMLRRAGLDQVLIDLGEIRALGDHPDGRPWRAGIANPLEAGTRVRDVPLRNAALATSSPSGLAFDPDGRFHHLFDPRDGSPASRHASVSVRADTATAADALSTGFSALPLEQATALCRSLPDVQALFLAPDGTQTSVGL